MTAQATRAPSGASGAEPLEQRTRDGRASRWTPTVLVVGVLVLGVWGAATATTVALAYMDLSEAREAFGSATRELRDAELSGARVELAAGIERARRASSRLHRPYVVPVRPLPVVGGNLRTVTVVTDGALDTAEAADELLTAAHTIVHDDREAVPGEVSLDYLSELAPPMHRVADALLDSVASVTATPERGLLGPVARVRDAYLGEVGPLAEQAGTAADVAAVLPRMLGAETPRTYLLVAASTSELRGSGGLLGSWSTLVADAGHLDVADFADVDELSPPDSDVRSPADDFRHRYGARGALRDWRNVNLTPDFPTAAETMLRLWEAEGRPALDGVIMVDPVVFERVAHRSGPMEIPGVGEVAPSEVLEFVALDAYATFDDDRHRKRVLGDVATAAFATTVELLEEDDVPRTAQLLYDLAADGHLRVYSREPQVQAVMGRAGVAGGLPAVDGEFAGVFVNNVAANKVDWFTTRHIDHHVRLLPGGRTRATIGIELDNGAPSEGLPRHVLGPWTPHTHAGDNLSLVSVLCGRTCTPDPVPEGLVDGGTEQGHPVVESWLRTPAGGTRTLQHRTSTDGGWQEEDGEAVVRVTHLVQPTLHGTELRVRVALPPGWEPSTLPEGAHVEGDEILWVSPSSGLVQLTFRLMPGSM